MGAAEWPPLPRNQGDSRSPVLYACVAAAVAVAVALGGNAVPAALAGPVALAVVLVLLDARRRIGHTLGGIRSWALDPFVPLGLATVLAVAHSVAAQRYAHDSQPFLSDGLLLLSALFLAQGLVGLLSERLRSHAMELAREAAFVSAIMAVGVWLAWMEESWLNGDIAPAAVLTLSAAAAPPDR